MKRLIVFLSALLSTSAYAENFTATDKVLFFSTDVLIEVIERNFDKNLQLDVANKYIELMDSATHSVSIADLTTICATGQIDSAKCRNFISDLFTTMGIGDTVKPFYWADYIPYSGDEPSNTFVPHMGFEQDSGVWTIRFPWMKEQSFRKQYPGVEHLGGISACTAESGTVHIADASKNFAQNEQTGNNCWCKMTYPEESAWVYHTGMDSVATSTGETTDSDTMCNRGCALECLSGIRGADKSMRAAMFTAVKLNGSNEHGTIDSKKIKDEFKPCEFDWAHDTKWNNDYPWYGWKTQHPSFWLQTEYIKWNATAGDNFTKDFYANRKEDPIHYERNAKGLKYEEWAAGGFNWMKSEGFQCKYPGATKIKGVATCNKEKATSWGQTTNKKFTPEERTGYNCWCKMTYPEQSKWFFSENFNISSKHKTETWYITETTTQNDEVIRQRRYTEERNKSKEQIELNLQVDISYCESVCLQSCAGIFANSEDYEIYAPIFRTIGTK